MKPRDSRGSDGHSDVMARADDAGKRDLFRRSFRSFRGLPLLLLQLTGGLACVSAGISVLRRLPSLPPLSFENI